MWAGTGSVAVQYLYTLRRRIMEFPYGEVLEASITLRGKLLLGWIDSASYQSFDCDYSFRHMHRTRGTGLPRPTADQILQSLLHGVSIQ
jgi:hypothetical protein